MNFKESDFKATIGNRTIVKIEDTVDDFNGTIPLITLNDGTKYIILGWDDGSVFLEEFSNE